MEQLAHRLWFFRQKTLDYRALEKWLRGQLTADPETPLQYGAYLNREGGLDILQEDLRNASFLVREGEDRFRFAHTSIMEFFLARALFRALLEIGEQAGDLASTTDRTPDLAEDVAKAPLPPGETLGREDQRVKIGALAPLPSGEGLGRGDQRIKIGAFRDTLPEQSLVAWKIPVPSPETLDFLGELLRKTDQALWQPAFRTIRRHYRQGISELALAYGLHAHRHGLPTPSLVGMDLTGADLKDWRFEGPNDGPPLNLSQVHLAGSRLMSTRFRRVNLSDADLTRAELWGGTARSACFQDADLTGADLRTERRHRTQHPECRVRCVPATYPTYRLACGWSPEGRRLVSGGWDGSLRLWDAASGEPQTIIQMFRNREHAVLAADGSGFRSASPGAWRWLGWQVKDPKTGRIERLPAETFGPIPGMDP